MRRLPYILILWLALAAFMSGSSHVFIRGEYYLLAAESVRKIFQAGTGEQSWHRNWRTENQLLLEKGLRAVMAGVLDSLVRQPEQFADSVQVVAALLLPIDPQLSIDAQGEHVYPQYSARTDSSEWAAWRASGKAGYYEAQDLFEVGGRSWAIVHLKSAPLKSEARALDSLLRSRLRPAARAWRNAEQRKRDEEQRKLIETLMESEEK